MSSDQELEGPIAPLPRIGNIPGIKIRYRSDPGVTKRRVTFRIVRQMKRSIRGLRVYFTIYDKETPLFTTKMKGRKPEGPLPIAKGPEMHYRDNNFAGYLLSGDNHSQFSLRVKEPFGTELLAMHFSLHNGDKRSPRDIRVNFFIRDSIIPDVLVNKRPEFNPDGYWELDFGDRFLISSIRNVILIREEDGVEYLCIRKIEKNIIEADAAEVVSPLTVFGVVLSLFECGI